MRRAILTLILTIAAISVARAGVTDKNIEKAVDYIGVKGPVEFCGQEFYLAWSSHPMETYYLQEYLPKGETLERYNEMLTLSVLIWDKTPREAAYAKAEELEQRKKTDKVCQYMVAENDGEYIVDFIVSDSNGDTLDCVEADVHHYRQITVNGRKATMLTFYSRRAYGDDILPFMQTIPTLRPQWYDALSRLNIKPHIKKNT